MTTKTYYTTQSHKYIDCTDPDNCTKDSHWYAESGSKYTSRRGAEQAAEMDDAPAVNIIEVTRRVVGRRG